MAKDPAFLFYPGDWQGGTTTFSRHLKGCYIDVLIAQFNSGPLSIEEIKTVLGTDFAAWGTLSKKFKRTDNGLFFNERLEIEKKKRAEYSLSQRNKRLGKIKTHETSHEKQVIEHMENKNEDRIEVEIGIGGLGENPKYQKILSSTIWLESICMQKNIPKDQVQKLLDDFLKDLWLKEDFEKPEKDIKKHFISWLNIQIKNNGTTKFTGSDRQARTQSVKNMAEMARAVLRSDQADDGN